jgi:tetratricopeptide (TPR) repeat protein
MGLGALFRLETDQVPLQELRPRPSNEQRRWLLGWGLGGLVLTGLAGLVTVQAFRADYLLYGAMQKAAVYRKDASLFAAERNVLRTEFLSETQAGMAINPHHRSTTVKVAEALSLQRDVSDAAIVWEKLAASRPYVAVFYANLVLAYGDLRDTARAEQHLATLRKLKPDTVLVDSLTVRLLIQKGDHRAAADYLNMSFGAKRFDLSMLQAGYALGLKLGDHNLAVRSLRLRIVALPQMASDTYFRIGMVYVDAHDQLAAVEAFRQGMDLLPASEKPSFNAKVPPAYRKLI